MDMKENKFPEPISVILFVSLIGTSLEPVLVKYFSFGISPFSLILLKSMFGGFLFLPFIKKLKQIPTNKFPDLFFVSALAFITNALIFFSVERIPASVLITIISSTPVIVGFINFRRGTVELSLKFAFAFVFVMFGIILTLNSMSFRSQNWAMLGVLFALASVLTSTLYRIKMDDLTQETNPVLISTFLFTTNGLVSLIFIPFIQVPTGVWPFTLWLGITAVVANIAFLYAIKHLGSTRVSMLSIIQRPFAVLFGAILLNEVISIEQIIGMIFIFVGVYYAKAKKINVTQTKTIRYFGRKCNNQENL